MLFSGIYIPPHCLSLVVSLFSISLPPCLLGIRINYKGNHCRFSCTCRSRHCLSILFFLLLFLLLPYFPFPLLIQTSFAASPPFPTKHTSYIPLSSPTSVLASTPECVLNTLMLESARLMMNHDLLRAKDIADDGWALSGFDSERAMRKREREKSGVTIWELRNLLLCCPSRSV